MLSQCPHCKVPVLFTSEICPNCVKLSKPEERAEVQRSTRTEDSSRHDFEIIPATKGNQPLWLAVIAIFLGFVAVIFQAWLLVAFCALVAPLCSIVPVTTVYGNDGRIERTWEFLSLAPIWQNRYLASEFSEVRLTFRDTWNKYDNDQVGHRYWWFLELVRPTGKSIRVYQLATSEKTWTCREAQELQERLSKLTGLPTTELRLG